MTSAECFRCGGPAGHKFGNNYLCESCIPSSDAEPSKPKAEETIESSEPDTSGTFEAPTTVFPEQLRDVDQWVCWKYIDGTKKAFAPWSDRDHTEIDPETDARYSWSLPANWTSFTKAKEWASMVPDIDGVGFVLQKTSEPYTEGDADPFAFIDYDDVRDPDTGEVHSFVRRRLEKSDTFAQISTSGTGVHEILIGDLPDGVKTIQTDLPSDDRFSDAEIEVYDGKRFVAMTGDHIEGTPTEALESEKTLEGFADRFVTVPESKPDALVLEPERTRDEIAEVDETNEIRDIFDAVAHTKPRDIRLRSTVTDERADGTKDMDPSWARSESGTRLGQVGEGWIYRKGDIGLDALQVVALEERIITDEQEYPQGETFWKAVDALRERGAHIPEFNSGETTANPVSALPLAQLDALEPHERKRFARKHGLKWPETSSVRDRLEGEILQAVRSGQTAVIDAPTSVGKSYTVASTPWLNHVGTTGEQPVIHLHKTREARDDAAATSDKAGVSYRVLKGRKERCPVAAGTHDPNLDGEDPETVITINGIPGSEWLDAICDGKGVPFSVAHQYLAENNDQNATLPCEAGELECPALTQWEGLPRGEDGAASVDVIHATHAFARVPSLIEGCNVILDEQPDFTVGFEQDRIRRAVMAYLKAVDAPKTSFEAFVELASPFEQKFIDREKIGEARREMEAAFEREPGLNWYLEESDAHAYAPAFTRAIWNALRDGEPDSNGRRSAVSLHESPRFDESGEDYLADRLTVVLDADNTVRTVRVVPWFDAARSVIGLDAYPSMHLWQRNTEPEISRVELLDPEKRQLWRRFERGLTVVQVGDATRPFTSGEYFDNRGTQAVVEHLSNHYGQEFSTCITAGSVEHRTKQLMKNIGISDPELMHYGEEKSRNDFGNESVGLVNGCIDPGDDYVLDLLAECGLDAEPETEVDENGDEHRAHGRGFSGPDADAAADLLATVRENHVAQAAGRYARSADDPENRATVYVRTDAVPEGLVDIEASGVEWLYTDLQREIVKALRDGICAPTAKDIANELDCSKRHVLETLRNLEGVTRAKGAGEHGADVFDVEGDIGSGEVDLSIEELQTANDHVWSLSTWSFVVSDSLEEMCLDRGAPQPKGSSNPAITDGGSTDPPEGGGL